MGKLESMPRHTANLSRHGHDTSQGFVFTSSTGMILPVYQDFLLPGESVYFSDDFFARLNPVLTAFFGDIVFDIDWFFVPCPQMFTPFESIVYGVNDFLTDDSYNTQEAGTLSEALRWPLLDVYGSFGDLFRSIHPSNDWTNWLNDMARENLFDLPFRECFRLFNHLGINPYCVFKGINAPDGKTIFNTHGKEQPNVSPWFFAAYQSIFYNFFANDDRTHRKVSAYNFDSKYGVVNFINREMVRLHYCQRGGDYFTNAKVNPVTSAVNVLQADDYANGLSALNLITEFEKYLDNSVINTSNLNSAVSDGPDDVTSVVSVPNNDLSAAGIRQLFAVDKLLRIIGRSDKTYDAQVLAHFGYKVPLDVKHQLQHLKRSEFVMNSEVLASTANTYDSSTGVGSPLGEIGGNAQASYQSKPDKFTAPCHGVLMATVCSYVRPYYHGAFDMLNQITGPQALPQPEFDKLGMQPLFGYNLNTDGFGYQDGTSRFGWLYRYQEYKKKFNRVSEVFAEPQLVSGKDQQVNMFAPWVLSKTPLGAAGEFYSDGTLHGFANIGEHSFYQSPSDLNQIMVIPFNNGISSSYWNSPWLMLQSDPIFNRYRANVKKVSVFSPTGEPDL